MLKIVKLLSLISFFIKKTKQNKAYLSTLTFHLSNQKPKTKNSPLLTPKKTPRGTSNRKFPELEHPFY